MIRRSLIKLLLFSSILIGVASCKSMVKSRIQRREPEPKVTSKAKKQKEYHFHRDIKTTSFYIGQHEPSDSGMLDNRSSAWTGNWVKAYGSIDRPAKRDGYFPEGFLPMENPFYFALPYNDLTKCGYKDNIEGIIPWIKEAREYGRVWPYSYCKNRWIRIIYNDRVCYAQWEDVGPFETDDWQYVFGTLSPKNTVNGSVGLDISPACYAYLGMIDNDYVHWQFVDFEDVPEGPWKKVITTSNPNWN
jgi:hypothetical protein